MQINAILFKNTRIALTMDARQQCLALAAALAILTKNAPNAMILG